MRNTIKIDPKMKRTVKCSQCDSQNIQDLFESTEDWLMMRNRSTNEIVGVNSKMYQEAYDSDGFGTIKGSGEHSIRVRVNCQ